MVRTQTLVQLTDRLVRLLDEEASALGLSRSALIRDILDEHLADRARDRAGSAIAEGYRRKPPGRPDAWGDLDETLDAAARDTALRLDTEEGDEGHPPW